MLDTLTTRTLHARPGCGPDVRPWVWPLPRVDGFKPSIVATCADDWKSIDVGYETGKQPTGLVPVFAAHDGVLTYAGKMVSYVAGSTKVRYAMCLDHPGGWSTRYGDLEHMFAVPTDRFRRRKARVRAGDVLGYANRSPVQVRFELWQLNDDGLATVDPAPHMREWLVLPWKNEPEGQHQTAIRVAA